FFFQAEDGIRDRNVTGVQTCALPISNGLIGQWFAKFDIQVAFTPLGIWLALVVVSFPFIVRAVQPVLAELSVEFEEAAAVLGAKIGRASCRERGSVWVGAGAE